jgi:hypothetical protein
LQFMKTFAQEKLWCVVVVVVVAAAVISGYL